MQLNSRGVNPMSAGGDLIIGGGGTPTGYTLAAGSGVAGIVATAEGTIFGAPAQIHDGTKAGLNGNQCNIMVGGWHRYDLGAVKQIGRSRVWQYDASAAARCTAYRIQAADDAAGPWTDVHTFVGADFITHEQTFALPFSARWWRFFPDAGGGSGHLITEWELDAVTTVGAGNQTRLAAPVALPQILRATGAGPGWHRGAAIADLGAGTAVAPAAYVGVDVAAAGPAQVALLSELNDLRTVVAALRVDRDADRAKTNAVLTALETAGVLAP